MSTQGRFERTKSWPQQLCKCGRFCNPMETEDESLCCRDNSEILEENYNGNFFVCSCV